MYQIELYKMDGMFCATIGTDNGSGYDVVGKTREECSAKIAKYFEDYGEWNEDAEWNDEEE